RLPGKEAVESKLGKFVARHLTATAERNGRALEYHMWLTPDVPFGWARMEVRESRPGAAPRTVFTATAAETGGGAESEVEESKAKYPMLSPPAGASSHPAAAGRQLRKPRVRP